MSCGCVVTMKRGQFQVTFVLQAVNRSVYIIQCQTPVGESWIATCSVELGSYNVVAQIAVCLIEWNLSIVSLSLKMYYFSCP